MIYLVSDLSRQYNEKYGTTKRFKNYLDNKQAQEVTEYPAKTVERNSALQANEDQKGKFDIPHMI